jgi:uncharacterized repeat protein (TIGR03803 family)
MKSTKSGQSNFIEQPTRRRICTSWIVPLLLPWMLPAGLSLMMAGRVTAQTFTTLYNFTSPVFAGGLFTGGIGPSAGLILSGNTLFGTAGDYAFLTVFAVHTDGTGFTNLYSIFNAVNEGGVERQLSGLILSSNTLYGKEWGSAFGAPSIGFSEVFALNTDGTGFTNLYETSVMYPASDGGGGLILSGNTLYGTTEWDGSSGNGAVFALNTDGTGFTTLYSFTARIPDNDTNSDGAFPNGLILSGNTLYGTASSGGSGGNGTVFALNTDGMGFTTLYSFTATFSDPYGYGSPYSYGTNSDGSGPGGLILSGNTLYGTTEWGGSPGYGTVFAVNTDGTGFTTLYSFTGGSDGANPYAGLILSGNTLYGTTEWGGSSGNGTVFALNTDGTGFTVLHTFTALYGPYYSSTNSDGANPQASLILSGNTLYGTAKNGGTNGLGTVFSIFIQPQLTIIPSGPYMILAWPTNYSGFTLQSTTNLGSSAVWATNSPPPAVIGGQNVVINTTTTGKQQFYRLSSP